MEKENFTYENFSASSSSAPSPVLPLLPALHRVFSEDDLRRSRAHVFHSIARLEPRRTPW